MKMFFWTNGDESVGINGDSGFIEVKGWENTDEFFQDMDNPKERKKEFKKDIFKCLSPWFENTGKLHVAFEEELKDDEGV